MTPLERAEKIFKMVWSYQYQPTNLHQRKTIDAITTKIEEVYLKGFRAAQEKAAEIAEQGQHGCEDKIAERIRQMEEGE